MPHKPRQYLKNIHLRNYAFFDSVTKVRRMLTEILRWANWQSNWSRVKSEILHFWIISASCCLFFRRLWKNVRNTYSSFQSSPEKISKVSRNLLHWKGFSSLTSPNLSFPKVLNILVEPEYKILQFLEAIQRPGECSTKSCKENGNFLADPCKSLQEKLISSTRPARNCVFLARLCVPCQLGNTKPSQRNSNVATRRSSAVFAIEIVGSFTSVWIGRAGQDDRG